MAIDVDMSDFLKKSNELLKKMVDQNMKALFEVGLEVMRLSSFEVPHDKGLLQNSGSVEPGDQEVIVGYNKVYAARLHEHPEYKFQKGRKAKYLEDPIKNNVGVLLDHYGNSLKEAL